MKHFSNNRITFFQIAHYQDRLRSDSQNKSQTQLKGFSEHNGIKLEINNITIFKNFSSIWKLNNGLLNNLGIRKRNQFATWEG
jgi:hypothetical protein